MEIIFRINVLLSQPIIGLVWLYQRTISPDHGLLRVFYPYGYCKFYPSCSEYARLTLKSFGLFGLPKIIKRIASCRPGNLGGVDLPHTHDKFI